MPSDNLKNEVKTYQFKLIYTFSGTSFTTGELLTLEVYNSCKDAIITPDPLMTDINYLNKNVRINSLPETTMHTFINPSVSISGCQVIKNEIIEAVLWTHDTTKVVFKPCSSEACTEIINSANSNSAGGNYKWRIKSTITGGESVTS